MNDLEQATVKGGRTEGRGQVGAVLFQLGGPDSLDAVEPFLYSLFSDPDIISFPFARLARQPLARLVAKRRAVKVSNHYAQIGGKSPIRELTERQAAGLERELVKRSVPAQVFVAMRYWHPLTEETARRVQAQSFRSLVLLPLYPQYSRTTTGSSLREWHRCFETGDVYGPLTTIIHDFHEHPLYVDAVVHRINQGLEKFASPAPHEGSGGVYLLFSAHGLPRSVIEAGDPYKTQVERTVKLVIERGGWRNPHGLCYQSRAGPGRWLEPQLDETLRSLARQDVKRLLVIPISFVSDHVETLYEIDLEARTLAYRCGIREFEMTEGLNDSPRFVAALADLVCGALAAGSNARRA